MTPSGKSVNDDDLSCSSNVHKQIKDRSPCLKVLRTKQESFAKAVDYCTYRPKNKPQRYNLKIAPEVAKLVENLRSPLRKTYFDEMDPISILTILKDFRDSCDSIGIHAGEATWLVSYFMIKPVSSPLEAQLSPKNIRVTGLHVEGYLHMLISSTIR